MPNTENVQSVEFSVPLCILHFSDPVNSRASLECALVLFIEGSSFLRKQLPFSKDSLANTAFIKYKSDTLL